MQTIQEQDGIESWEQDEYSAIWQQPNLASYSKLQIK